MNNTKLLCTLLILIAVLIQPLQVDAHMLETNGSIGAVLHVDPNDNPRVGEPATFFFEIKDKSGRFTLAECACQVIIAANGEALHTHVLPQDIPSFTYEFPENNVYTVHLDGAPVVSGAFEPFTLSYTVRVGDTNNQTRSPNTLQLLAIGALVSVIVLLLGRKFIISKR